ncbi:MAG: ATP-binding protein [Verrucomicrobia bacterium]|nr:ATP-binding protein [Verrucomicrobiota bacterium]MCH8525944.1 ATP-binding protein [Kiritimatiellia bacterium]
MKQSKFIPRKMAEVIQSSARQYPVVTVVGPRQSGKTTLVRNCFPDKPYVTLEAPDIRAFAREDPRGFLARYPDGAILDEFQRVPDLLSYLQGLVDEDNRAGRFILTGSQHFLMMRDVSQSLAGRTAVLTLWPLSLDELPEGWRSQANTRLIHSGFYPRVHADGLNPREAYRDYFATYVERDVRSLLKVHDLQLFETFVRLCAGRVGQLLNLTSLGNDIGLAASTVREWLNLLETSFILYRLPPYHTNLGKRLVKTPKLYFVDTGLAAHLNGIEEASQLNTHPLRGQLFENLVVSELTKYRIHRGREPRLYFYRDSTGNEVDVLYPSGPDWLPVEIKSGQTISSDAFKGLNVFQSVRPDAGPPGLLVYGGTENQSRSAGRVTGLPTLHGCLPELNADV